MESLNLIDTNIVNALVWTIMHSIWQFTLIALVMSILLKMFQNSSPILRYNIALASLGLSFLVAAVTFYYSFESQAFYNTYLLMTSPLLVNTGIVPIDNSSLLASIYQFIEVYQKPIFLTWMVGFIIFLLKFIISFGYVEFLSKTAKPIFNNKTYRIFRKIYTDLNIKQKIEIGESKYISSPMILGVFKPIILFPIGIINHLDINETEAIIAHELAHFVRKDIYINTIQNIIEVLFYYHPAIWWISTNIKLERENCCDDQAIKYVGNNIQYAKTLVRIQEMAHSDIPYLALQFSKKNSFFTNRIKRILQMTQTRNYLKEKVLTSLLLLALIVFFSKDVIGNDPSVEDSVVNKEYEMEINTLKVKNDSIPHQKESIIIQRKTEDQDVKLSMENGKVTNLEIDGKKVDEKDYDKYKDIINDVNPRSHKKGNASTYFFGDGGNHMNFEFENHMGLDSLLKGFDFKSYGSFDQGQMREEMNKLKGQLGTMKFNLKGLDSLRFNLEDFDFPDMGMMKNHPNMKFYHFGEGEFPGLENEFHFYDGDNFDHPQLFREFDHESDGNFSESIGKALNRDGLLIPYQENRVELTGKYLKINGEKQPSNIWQKYKRIFEEQSGAVLQKNSKLEFKFEGKESKRKYRVY